MNLKLNIISGILLLICLMGCVDTIDFNTSIEDQKSLAIQGQLIKGDPNEINVQVKRVFGFKSGSSLQNVASVQLSNDLGQVLELSQATLVGTYQDIISVDDPNFEVRYGGQYKLRVETVDDRIYETPFEPLYEVPRIDSVSTIVSEESAFTDEGVEVKNSVKYILHTPLEVAGNLEKARLYWQLEKTYQLTDKPAMAGVASKTCYITDNVAVESFAPMDANESTASYLGDYELIDLNTNFQFQEGFYLNLYQQSLSKGAYQYFLQISELLERSGNMFEKPVGKITTNFENINNPDEDVFGYFYATDIDTAHVKVSPYQIYTPIPGRYCPPLLTEVAQVPCPFEMCCDCLVVDRSTTTKPGYWE